MKSLILTVLSLGVFSASLKPALADGALQPLFNGKDFSGWSFVTTPATDIARVCRYNADGSLAFDGKPTGFLTTASTYSNYHLHAEFRWSGKAGNGGILVHISSGPKDRQWPVSFQIQTRHTAVGDLLPMAGATFVEPLTSPTGAPPARTHSAPDSEKQVGEWNDLDVECQGDGIKVTVNGVLQNQVTGCSVKEGAVGFQFEGTPFELRNVTSETLK